jgi:hypothetical protein
MSLHIAAQNLASQGRGPDNTLVHMSRKEVNSLNSLARAHGGHLTTNPHTGLPEAGFLSSILPMLAGAALTATGVGAPMAALMVGGGMGIATGSLQKGLMAGLGAYGGAGLGSGLMAAGAEGVGAGAASNLGDMAATGAGATPAAGMIAPAAAAPAGGISSLYGAPTDAMGALTSTSAAPQAAAQAAMPMAPPAPTPVAPAPAPVTAAVAPAQPVSGLSQMGQGIQNLGSSAGREAFMGQAATKGAEATGVGGGSGLFKYGMAAAAPMLTGKDQAGYKSSGPNPYEYSYDYKTGQYTRQPTGYRDAQTVTPPQAMAMGGMAQGGLDFAGQNTFAAGGGPGGLNMNALQQQQMTQQPQNMASGGMSDLGSYSDGGRMLRGPGDGVSDSIPAMIGSKRPARLADGEFVVPARVVSELGNGSSEAGARKLYAMMDRVQGARKKSIGKGKLAVNSRADKMLPA